MFGPTAENNFDVRSCLKESLEDVSYGFSYTFSLVNVIYAP